jgi:hypothetical protein
MYSVVLMDKRAIVIPSEYVQPTYKILAFGITDKQRAYEIAYKIRMKRNKLDKQ